MRVRIASLGDSLIQGTGITGTASTYEQGGRGSWWELARDRLATIPGVGPLLSPGRRMTSLGYASQNASEWTFAGVHTAVTSADAFDKVPYGGSGIQGFRWGNGITVVDTWTKQAWMPPILAVEVDIIDIAGGGEIQYRIDGGTWTSINQGANLLGNNTWLRFRIGTAITSTIEFRAYNGTTGINMLIVAVEPLFSLATAGFIWDNLAINGSKLNEMFVATSGDRMAWCDSVRLGTGGPASPHPNMAVTNMNINDVLLASTSGWDTDETALRARIPASVRLGLINPWENSTATYNQTQQTNYRAHTKTNAAAFSPVIPVLDFYDQWSSNGWTGNAAAVTAGLLADGIHQTQAGHVDMASRFYGWMLNNFFTIGKAGNIFSVGSSPLGSATALLGGQVETILPDGKTVAVTPGASTVKATNTLAATGKAVAATAGAPTIHATRSISPSGVAVGATAGSPTLRPGALTLAATGKAVAVTAGAPTLRAANTIAATGKAVTATPGTASLTARYALLPSGKAVAATAGSPTLHAAYTLHPSGKAVAVTPGASAPTSPNTILASAGYSQAIAVGVPTLVAGVVRLLPSGKAVAATAGAPALHATNVIAATGKAVTVTPGSPTTHSTATLFPTGKAVAATPGSPTLRGANTIVATGKAVTTTAGSPTVRSTRTLLPTGKAVTATAGAATVAPGVARLHPSGVAVAVTPGVLAVVGGQGEPSTVTVTVVPTMRATVAVLPHATATVSV